MARAVDGKINTHTDPDNNQPKADNANQIIVMFCRSLSRMHARQMPGVPGEALHPTVHPLDGDVAPVALGCYRGHRVRMSFPYVTRTCMQGDSVLP